MADFNTHLTFSELRKANVARLPEFKNRRGEITHSDPEGHDWSIMQWLCATAGEMGEAANIAKKIERGDYADEDEGKRALARELADTVIYCDLAANRLGIDLGAAVAEKFNVVSDRVGAKTRLVKVRQMMRASDGGLDGVDFWIADE